MVSRISQARKFLSDIIIDARNSIYNQGIPITSSRISPLFKEMSLVPTMVCQVLNQ